MRLPCHFIRCHLSFYKVIMVTLQGDDFPTAQKYINLCTENP